MMALAGVGGASRTTMMMGMLMIGLKGAVYHFEREWISSVGIV